MNKVNPTRARSIRLRMSMLAGLLAMGLGVVVSGAHNIQVRDGDAWRALAEKQRLRRLHITPKRGTVFDRNGTPLAISVEVPSVSVDAVEMLRGIDKQYVAMRIKQYADRIGYALEMEPASIAEKLSRGRRFAWLKRRVTPQQIEAIRGLQDRHQRYPIRGLMIEGEGRRFYPHRELAGPLLGFVSPDGMGRDGIELSLDAQLRGRAEEIRGLRDRAGRLIFADGIQDESALAGHNIHLTIDQSIQFIADRELQAAMKTHEARGGSVVVVDPATGEILALANAPVFNPNDYNTTDANSRRDRAVVDRFEPGSTLKPFAMAAALAAHTVKPDDSIYCEEGRMPIDNVVINDTHISKWLSPTQILQVSSNIGMAKIALGLGERKLYQSLRRFGFGEKAGLPVPGESSGRLRPMNRPWVPVETATAAYGQGVTVTNLQMAMAMAALANNGKLLSPMLVKRVTDSAGVVLTEGKPKLRRRAVSARVARLVGEMLTSVTEGAGTGVEAAIDGFRVAGKTGTAQKVDPATGRYSDTQYVASFVGFVPAERPRLVVSVVIDEPMAGTTAGGTVAAPVFRRITEMSLRYLGVRPRGTKSMKLADVGLAIKNGGRASQAYKLLSKARRDSQRPAPTEWDEPPPAASHGRTVKVPELVGLPARAAIVSATQAGLRPIMRGTGRVVYSEPEVGTRVAEGARIVVILEPQS